MVRGVVVDNFICTTASNTHICWRDQATSAVHVPAAFYNTSCWTAPSGIMRDERDSIYASLIFVFRRQREWHLSRTILQLDWGFGTRVVAHRLLRHHSPSARVLTPH